MGKREIVYVLTNPLFDEFVKIGMTENLERRLSSHNSSVPVPFCCEYAVEVDNYNEIEKLIHQEFDDHRKNKKREFFELNPQSAIAVLKALERAGDTDVTPEEDYFDTQDERVAFEQKIRERERNNSFDQANIKSDTTIFYINDNSRMAKVIDNKCVEFENETMSLRKVTLNLLKLGGYKTKTVNGWNYWEFEGEIIKERIDRLRREEKMSDDGTEDE